MRRYASRGLFAVERDALRVLLPGTRIVYGCRRGWRVVAEAASWEYGARVYGKIMLSIFIKFIGGLCSAARENDTACHRGTLSELATPTRRDRGAGRKRANGEEEGLK